MIQALGADAKISRHIQLGSDNSEESPDALGRLALHRLVDSTQCSWRAANRLIARQPGALLHFDKNGMLPIHIAAIRGHSSTARLMLRVHPELALMCDDRGRTVSDFKNGRSESWGGLDMGYECSQACGCWCTVA